MITSTGWLDPKSKGKWREAEPVNAGLVSSAVKRLRFVLCATGIYERAVSRGMT